MYFFHHKFQDCCLIYFSLFSLYTPLLVQLELHCRQHLLCLDVRDVSVVEWDIGKCIKISTLIGDIGKIIKKG